jgi:hypothetical protein
MPQSGQEMLDESINCCKKIADGLGKQNKTWEASVEQIIEKFEEVSDTFFFKTMPSVPVTRTAMREAASLLDFKDGGDWSNFEAGLQTMIATAQAVIEKAGMKGTTLT